VNLTDHPSQPERRILIDPLAAKGAAKDSMLSNSRQRGGSDKRGTGQLINQQA